MRLALCNYCMKTLGSTIGWSAAPKGRGTRRLVCVGVSYRQLWKATVFIILGVGTGTWTVHGFTYSM